MNASLFAVVQTDFTAIPADVLERILFAQTSWPRIDVKRLAIESRGIIASRFTLDEANSVKLALGNEGFSTAVLPVAQMMTLPHSRSIAWLDVGPQAMSVPLDAHQEVGTPVPWNNVVAIHAAIVTIRDDASEIVTEDVHTWGRAHTFKTRRVVRKAFGVTTPMLGILALSAERQMLHVRMSMNRFFLNRMPWLDARLKRPDQFRAVLGALIAYSRQAIVSAEAQALTAEIPRLIGEQVDESYADRDHRAFQAEMNWLLQLLALRFAASGAS